MVSCIYLEEIRYTLSDTHHKFLMSAFKVINFSWTSYIGLYYSVSFCIVLCTT